MAKRKPRQTSSHRIYSNHWCSKLMFLKVYNFPSLYLFLQTFHGPSWKGNWPHLHSTIQKQQIHISTSQAGTWTHTVTLQVVNENIHLRDSHGDDHVGTLSSGMLWHAVYQKLTAISGEPTVYIYPGNRYTEFLQKVHTSLPCYMLSRPPKLIHIKWG